MLAAPVFDRRAIGSGAGGGNPMQWISRLLAAVVVLLPLAAAGAEEVGAGAAAYAPCAACHGPAAQGDAALGAPRLSHLGPAYLKRQLQGFRSGVRGGEGAAATAQQMAGMAMALADDAAVERVVEYIGTLQSPSPGSTVEGDAALGADYYNQFCGACHGARAQGNPSLNSPRLAGSDDWYLLAQLEAFRDGRRGAHPEDRIGRQMRSMALVLPSEQAARDVVSFIGSIAP
jgi:cytochrome c553